MHVARSPPETTLRAITFLTQQTVLSRTSQRDRVMKRARSPQPSDVVRREIGKSDESANPKNRESAQFFSERNFGFLSNKQEFASRGAPRADERFVTTWRSRKEQQSSRSVQQFTTQSAPGFPRLPRPPMLKGRLRRNCANIAPSTPRTPSSPRKFFSKSLSWRSWRAWRAWRRRFSVFPIRSQRRS